MYSSIIFWVHILNSMSTTYWTILCCQNKWIVVLMTLVVWMMWKRKYEYFIIRNAPLSSIEYGSVAIAATRVLSCKQFVRITKRNLIIWYGAILLKKMGCRTSWNWQNHDCQGDCQGIECCFSLCSVVCFLFDNHDYNRSSINNMWLGESEKIIDSLFSLAKKLSPCILFIDEADILLGSRKSFQNEVSFLSSELVT